MNQSTVLAIYLFIYLFRCSYAGIITIKKGIVIAQLYFILWTVSVSEVVFFFVKDYIIQLRKQ